MKRWASIEHARVNNVVEQEDMPTVHGDLWVECPGWVSPQDSYENGVFSKCPDPLPPSIISKLGMLNRFTEEEYSNILLAAKTDVYVQIWLEKFNAANKIDLTNSQTVEGFSKLVQKGLLTQDRCDDILTTPVSDSESA